MNTTIDGHLFALPSAFMVLLFVALFPFALSAQESIWVEGSDADSHDYNEHGWYGSSDLRLDFLSPGVPEESDGTWLVHYTGEDETEATATYEVDAPSGGDYTWWARLAAHQATYEVRVGDGDWQRFVVSNSAVSGEDVLVPHERINLVQPGIDIRSVGWVNLGSVELEEGANSVDVRVVHSEAFGQTHGGVDAMVFSTDGWSPSGALRPDELDEQGEAGAWFPLIDAAADAFSQDSVIDMSVV